MTRRLKPVPVRDEDGPFRYVYLAVAAVPGLRLSEEQQECLPLHSFPDLHAEAFLTSRWDEYCAHMDRSNAIALLLLTGFTGRPRFLRLLRFVEFFKLLVMPPEAVFASRFRRETKAEQERRHKSYSTPGCYL